MQNKELREPNAIYIQDSGYNDNEISLIDLAIILIRRKKLIAFISISILFFGVFAALVIPKTYTYSTSIEIGSQILSGKISTFEAPQTLLAKLQHSYIPKTLNNYNELHTDSNRVFKLEASIPKNSQIIVLKLKGLEKEQKLISALLEQVTQRAIDDHKRVFLSLQHDLKSRLQSSQEKLQKLGDSEADIAEKNRLEGTIDGISAQLVNLRSTREILPPMRSVTSTSMSRKLIVLISAALGLLIAIFAAFMTEFAAKVKAKQQNT